MKSPETDAFWLQIIYIISAVIVLAVAFLILGPRPEGMQGMLDVSGLPKVNALLNSVTTMLLIAGWILIKQKKRELHKKVISFSFHISF